MFSKSFPNSHKQKTSKCLAERLNIFQRFRQLIKSIDTCTSCWSKSQPNTRILCGCRLTLFPTQLYFFYWSPINSLLVSLCCYCCFVGRKTVKGYNSTIMNCMFYSHVRFQQDHQHKFDWHNKSWICSHETFFHCIRWKQQHKWQFCCFMV